MERISKIHTIYTFNNPLPLERNILGERFNFYTKTLNGYIYIPTLPDSYSEIYKSYSTNKLLSPKNCIIEDQNNWGVFYNDGSASVQKCYIEFTINYDMIEIHSKKAFMHNSLINKELMYYFFKFLFFIEYYSKTSILSNRFKKMEQIYDLDLFVLDEFGKPSIIGNKGINLVMNIPSIDPINIQDFRNSIDKSNNNVKIKLFQAFLKKGASDFSLNDFRSSIINICTSLETFFSEFLLFNYNEDSSKIKMLDMEEYRGLVGRLKLIKKIKKPPYCSYHYSKRVGEIRNNTVHSGYFPTKDECKRALEMAYKTINFYGDF